MTAAFDPANRTTPRAVSRAMLQRWQRLEITVRCRACSRRRAMTLQQ